MANALSSTALLTTYTQNYWRFRQAAKVLSPISSDVLIALTQFKRLLIASVLLRKITV
jgi:hypothetical protein